MTSPSSLHPHVLDFRMTRPAYEAPQSKTLDWIAQLHAEAERSRSADAAAFDAAAFHTRMRKLLYRYGCSPEKIGMRGYEVADSTHTAWGEMDIYDVVRRPEGAGSSARTQLYARIVESAVDRLYPDSDDPPGDLVHVTCTGYASPNAAQKLVAKRGWGSRTRITNAYHMGCYASLPALRIAGGFAATASASSGPERVDIVHNEVCTLHLRPADHSPEQLVVQSLFGDGHIRYSVVRGDRIAPDSARSSLEVLSLREEILPDSTEAMTWSVSDHGMYMTLTREVPARIASVARDFSRALFAEAGIDFARERPRTLFAIHPGGPKVIDVMQQALELSAAQVAASRDVLFRYGNMSSATLPHIWMNLVESPDVPVGTLIASFAFGPGLTASGALMVKR
jgi:predicted naringenin-chalcone synthase